MRERSIRLSESVPHWAGMDVQHASKSGTLASPLSVAIEVPVDENLEARTQKLGGMHEHRTMER